MNDNDGSEYADGGCGGCALILLAFALMLLVQFL